MGKMMLRCVKQCLVALGWLCFSILVYAFAGNSVDEEVSKLTTHPKLGEQGQKDKGRSPPSELESEQIEYIIVPIEEGATMDRFEDTVIDPDQVLFKVEKAPKGQQEHYDPNKAYTPDELQFLNKKK